MTTKGLRDAVIHLVGNMSHEKRVELLAKLTKKVVVDSRELDEFDEAIIEGAALKGLTFSLLPPAPEVPFKRKETPQSFKPKHVEGWYD